MADRDANGRFVKGHNGCPGAGRKSRETEQRYLELFRGCVSEDDAKAIVLAAVNRAKTRLGQPERKWLFDYLIGQPVQRIAQTDPTGEHEYLGLGDAEIVAELTRLLDAARARAGSAADGNGASSVGATC